MTEERLQKVLAAAGVASRRASEEMILAGRVTVDGQTITEMGYKVDPAKAVVAVDGRAVLAASRHVYLKLYKPRGVLSDIGGATQGRQTVADYVPPKTGRVYPVGRLDLNSEGLVLLTDDGNLAHKLTHPRFEHPKTYFVLVGERPTHKALETLRTGVELPEGKTAPAEVRLLNSLPDEIQLGPGPKEGVWLEIVLREGKKRQIRHMTAAVGYPTLRLVRWAIGPLVLGNLRVGESVALTRNEVFALRQALLGRKTLPPKVGAPRRNTRGAGQARAGAKSDTARGGTPKPSRPAAPRRAPLRRPRPKSAE